MKYYNEVNFPSQQKLYDDVRNLSSRAMRYIITQNQQAYINVTDHLAEACALLNEFYVESVPALVSRIEQGALVNVDLHRENAQFELGFTKERLQRVKPSFFAEQEKSNLASRITALTNAIETPVERDIEGIVTDTLVRAATDYDMDIPDRQFSFVEYSPSLK